MLAERAAAHMQGPPERRSLDRLEAEQDNLRAAFGWSRERGEVAIGLEIASALQTFWYRRGYLTEGRGWLEWGLAAAREAPVPPEVVVPALLAAAWLAHTAGDDEAVAARAGEALALARSIDQQASAGHALLLLGVAAEANPEEARRLLAESVALLRKLDDRAWLPVALGNLGVVALLEGDRVGALALFEEQLALERGRGYLRGVARSLVDVGDVALEDGDAGRALAAYREALRLFYQEGDRTYSIICLLEVGICLVWEPERAARLFGAVAALREQTGLGVLHALKEPYDRALKRVREELGEERFAAVWAAGRALTLEQAVVEASAPSPSPTPAPPAPLAASAVLTPREADVLRLLVAGRSNQQIADALSISLATTKGHVTNILGKLGVESRSAAIAQAVRQGLV
jgi:DNA-binding CsgD family transcriptional regulator